MIIHLGNQQNFVAISSTGVELCYIINRLRNLVRRRRNSGKDLALSGTARETGSTERYSAARSL